MKHFALAYQGAPGGRLLVGSHAGEHLSATDRRLLTTLPQQVGVAAHALTVTVELQHSRERLVRAREEERRRIRPTSTTGTAPG